MSNKKYYSHKSSKTNHGRKPHHNTNKAAWYKVKRKAPELGYDSKKMSRLYYQELESEKQSKKTKKSINHKPKHIINFQKKQSTTHKHVRKYERKRVILDKLREYRSPKVISSISDSLAEFIVKATAQELTNSQKNTIRSIIALATSEALNKAFEEELKVVDKVKTFIKVGKVVYKVILWYDEQSKTYRPDLKHIKKIPEYSIQYKFFLFKHPKLKEIYNTQNCLTLAEVKSGKRCLKRERLERDYMANANKTLETPNSCPYYYYCHIEL